MKVHQTALVDPLAELGKDVEIGPYSRLGAAVKLGDGCRLLSHVVLEGDSEFGEANVFHPFCTIGTAPQDLKYRGGRTRLKVGSNNVFREYVNVNIGTEGGGGVTSIGDHNLFMAYTHVAHDCHIGHHTIFANAATLGGHVVVQDHSVIGAFSGVHQFCRIGAYAFVGGYSAVTKDALPYMKTVGNRARVLTVNTTGLTRHGFDAETIARIRVAYRILFQSKLNTRQALERLKARLAGHAEIDRLIAFIESSERGIIKR